MNPWLETIAVILVTLAGISLGVVFSRLKRPWWLIGYFMPVVFVAVMLAARFSKSLSIESPLSWVMLGRVKFVMLSLVTTMSLITPLSRLPFKFEKVGVCVFITIIVFWFCILPFAATAFVKGDLAGLEPLVSVNGVCFQTTSYTCGPAAAVTALGRLGLSATEGQLAILSRSNPIVGTLPGCLCRALEDKYGTDGLRCQFNRFDSIDELKDAGITLVMVKSAFLVDHCVAVMEISDKTVAIADPALGVVSMSYKQFEKVWRFTGIVLKREAANI